MIFFISLIFFEFRFYKYWVNGSLGQILAESVGIAIVAFLSGRRALGEVMQRRSVKVWKGQRNFTIFLRNHDILRSVNLSLPLCECKICLFLIQLLPERGIAIIKATKGCRTMPPPTLTGISSGRTRGFYSHILFHRQGQRKWQVRSRGCYPSDHIALTFFIMTP